METRHPLSLPPVLRLANAFERSTGWSILRFDEEGVFLPSSRRVPLQTQRVAVMVDREVIGYLGLAQSNVMTDPLTPEPPQELLRAIAEILGRWISALSVARDNDEELSSLIEINRLLTSTTSLDRVHTVLCEAAARELEAQAVVLMLASENSDKLHIAGTYPLKLSETPGWSTWQSVLADSPLEQEALAGAPVVIPCPRDDTRCRHWPDELRSHPGPAICVGMIAHDRPMGTMVVLADEFDEVSLHSLRVLQAIANQGAFCIEQARLERDSQIKRILTQDMASASEIQNALLPHVVPSFENLELAVHRESYQAIGGDLYDFISIDNDRLGIVIGDASGKSITGALMMATVRGGLHAYVRDVYNIAEIMKRLNVTINQATLGEYFMTLFYGVLHLRTLEFSYVNGGHNAPLWFHDDRCTELEGGGTILGADPQCQYHVSTVQLSPGDAVIFYTDGLTEAMNDKGQMFRESRIQSSAFGNRNASAQQMLDSLLDAVAKFRGEVPPRDDMTVMTMKVLG